ncbi:hypothetical protein GCM10010342_74390 [Streptomyces anulatus]|nr:hypothetical protein GCM10010342_74390 [Streptomyces anulatus]
MRPEPIDDDDAEREEQLLAQVGRLERSGERGEHGASCDPRAMRQRRRVWMGLDGIGYKAALHRKEATKD